MILYDDGKWHNFIVSESGKRDEIKQKNIWNKTRLYTKQNSAVYKIRQVRNAINQTKTKQVKPNIANYIKQVI